MVKNTQRKTKIAFVVLSMFFTLFLLGVVSALTTGDSACMDSTNLCTSIYVYPNDPNYWVCDIDDTIQCADGCSDGACTGIAVPECSSSHQWCSGQARYNCVNNTDNLIEFCELNCINPTVTYAYCQVDPEFDYTLPENTTETTYNIDSVTTSSSLDVLISLTSVTNLRSCQKHNFDNVTLNSLTLDLAEFSSGDYSANVYMRVRDFDDDSVIVSDTVCTSCDDITFEGVHTQEYTAGSVVLDGDILLCGEFEGLALNEGYQATGSKTNADSSGVWLYKKDSASYVTHNSNYDLYFSTNTSTVSSVEGEYPVSINDINMGTSDSVSFNYSTVPNWTSINVYATDPTSNAFAHLYTKDSLSTQYTQFLTGFGVSLSPAGFLTVISYGSPYNASYVIEFCYNNEETSSSCTAYNVSVFITGSVSSVSLDNYFSDLYSLSPLDSYTFYPSQHFSDYTDIVLTCPDSNSSGVLNSTFPFTYSNNSDGYGNTLDPLDWLIHINCSTSDNTDYSFISDLNMSVSCGFGQGIPSYTISSTGSVFNYSNNCWFNASSNVSDTYATDYFFLTVTTSFYFPAVTNATWLNFMDSFVDVFPDYDTALANGTTAPLKMMALFMIVIVAVVGFLSFIRFGFRLCLMLTAFSIFLVLSFLVRLGYIGVQWPVALGGIMFVYFIVKLVRGA